MCAAQRRRSSTATESRSPGRSLIKGSTGNSLFFLVTSARERDQLLLLLLSLAARHDEDGMRERGLASLSIGTRRVMGSAEGTVFWMAVGWSGGGREGKRRGGKGKGYEGGDSGGGGRAKLGSWGAQREKGTYLFFPLTDGHGARRGARGGGSKRVVVGRCGAKR